MKIFKAFGYIAAADILSLFIGLTLASSANPLVRIISAVCACGIMVCLIASLGLKTARQDLKNQRITGEKTSFSETAAMAVTVSLPAAVSWLLLKVSLNGGFDFYRWHKIINGYFLQIFNFINPDASSAALSSGQVWLMLGLVFVPAMVFLVSYFLVYKGFISYDEN